MNEQTMLLTRFALVFELVQETLEKTFTDKVFDEKDEREPVAENLDGDLARRTLMNFFDKIMEIYPDPNVLRQDIYVAKKMAMLSANNGVMPTVPKGH